MGMLVCRHVPISDRSLRLQLRAPLLIVRTKHTDQLIFADRALILRSGTAEEDHVCGSCRKTTAFLHLVSRSSHVASRVQTKLAFDPVPACHRPAVPPFCRPFFSVPVASILTINYRTTDEQTFEVDMVPYETADRMTE